jgi:hypothetical protein
MNWILDAKHRSENSQLDRMIRDTLTIPATGADVECQCSLSGRITTAIRSRLNPDIISKIMMYKDHLTQLKGEMKSWKRVDICAGEEMEKSTEYEAPKEWRDQSWNK